MESVKKMDFYFMELNDIRITCKDSYEFLEKVKVKYPEFNTDLLLAAILYGMKQGELGYEYHLRQKAALQKEKPLPGFGAAS
jgi:hypothetical protein